MTQPLPPDVIKFLRDNAPPALVQEGDLTLQVAAKEWGVSEPTAQVRLNALVAAKKLTTEQRRCANGRIVMVYLVKR